MLTTAFTYIGLNFTLVVLILIADKKSAKSLHFTREDEMLLYSSTPKLDQRRYNGCILEVKFQEKAIWMNNRNFFQFRVILNDPLYSNFKVLKTMFDF